MRCFFFLCLLIFNKNVYSQSPYVIHKPVPGPVFQPIVPLEFKAIPQIIQPQNNSNHKNSVTRTVNKLTYKLNDFTPIDSDFNLTDKKSPLFEKCYLSLEQNKVVIYIPDFDLNLTLPPLKFSTFEDGVIVYLKDNHEVIIMPIKSNHYLIVLKDEVAGFMFNAIEVL